MRIQTYIEQWIIAIYFFDIVAIHLLKWMMSYLRQNPALAIFSVVFADPWMRIIFKRECFW